MSINKVVINDVEKLNLTADTITAAQVPNGVTFHNKAGEQLTGSAALYSSASNAAENTQPFVGEITTINDASGMDMFGAVSVPKGFHDGSTYVGLEETSRNAILNANNIRKGVSILGVEGTLEVEGGYDTSDATAQDYQVLLGSIAYGQTGQITGTMPLVIDPDMSDMIGLFYPEGTTTWRGKMTDKTTTVYIQDGYHDGTTYVELASDNLKPENIKKGVTILGVEGTYEGA